MLETRIIKELENLSILYKESESKEARQHYENYVKIVIGWEVRDSDKNVYLNYWGTLKNE